jgi:hypothetical protein
LRQEIALGIRQTLNENPGITTGLTAGIIVIALGIIIWQTVATNSVPTSVVQAFYSDDDGATFFVDSNSHIAPFDHHGKQAVRAMVFTCDGNKTKFVGYLQRYSPEYKAKLEAMRKSKDKNLELMQQAAESGIEVAAPHSSKWMNRNSPEARKMIDSVRCPNGSRNDLSFAWP